MPMASTSTANLVLNIQNNDDPVTLNGLDVAGGELTVYEKNLSDGTNPGSARADPERHLRRPPSMAYKP